MDTARHASGVSRCAFWLRPIERQPSLDAGALAVPRRRRAVRRRLRGGRTVLTPHAGEMAAMLGRDKTAIKADPLAAAREAASLFQSVVVMKGATSFVISPDGHGLASRRRGRGSWRRPAPAMCWPA